MDRQPVTDIASRIRDALAGGMNTEALDLARRALAEHPAEPEFAYLSSLACVRMGATGEAERWLRPVDLAQLHHSSLATDLSSLAGRIAKERYAAARGMGRRSSPLGARPIRLRGQEKRSGCGLVTYDGERKLTAYTEAARPTS